MKQKNILIFENNNDIINYLEDKSNTMFNYVSSNNNSNYTLIRKFITHSDLPTFWKRTDKTQELDRNLLYYLNSSEMSDIESRENKKFEVAKQSNISVPSIFFEKLWITQLERRLWHQEEQHNHILINDSASVFLVNDTLEYFSFEYTLKVFEKLSKNTNWKKSEFWLDFNWDFTEIELRHAIHWIWTSDDEVFHKLRRNIFKNDSLILLIEECSNWKKNLFILLDKNPKFFSIINETNKAYERYLLKEKQISEKVTYELVEDEKTRKFQNIWRGKLAQEMMNYTTEDEKIFCPFTLIEANFENAWTLYRASHIKPFSECNTTEAFDIDNWLLLVANADALFDKYLITISKDKELIFSFLIKNESLLIQRLCLNNSIFKVVLNENRMKYLESHREVFLKKEEERKK